MDWKRDMVMMKGGRTILLIDGETLIMETDVFTADGTMVRADGTLLLPDGSISVLREDEAIPIDIVTTRMAET